VTQFGRQQDAPRGVPFRPVDWSGTEGDEYYSSDLMYMIATEKNFSSTMDSVAASLTKMALDSSHETVTGVITTPEIYVHINWGWLVLPALLEIAGLVLLIFTALATRRRKVELWRSSILALLYHGVEEQTLREQEIRTDVAGMERAAKKVAVRLHPSGDDKRIVLGS